MSWAASREQARAAKVQDALYRIAELASAAQDMQEFYRAIHEIVGELMDAQSFFIALYDEERRADQLALLRRRRRSRRPRPIPVGSSSARRKARGVTAYVLRTEKPLHLRPERMAELVAQGEIEPIGTTHEDWLGVPLHGGGPDGRRARRRVVHDQGFRYTEQDDDLLAFVGQHVGAALSRARAIEETRQRNAELALINSVQSALAGELELAGDLRRASATRSRRSSTPRPSRSQRSTRPPGSCTSRT